jgi:hypothetical protein
MANWPALVIAPFLALANLSITYALAAPECSRQSDVAMHIVSAAILAVCVVLTLVAWRNWLAQGGGGGAPQREDDVAVRGRFMSAVAGMVGILSCLVVIAQWFPQWVLSPCAM